MNMDSESFYFIMLLFLFRGDKKSTSRTKQLRVVSGQERRGTTLVGLSDIPRYLRSGFLYESYNHNESDDEVCRKFDVPLNCLKKNTTVTSVQDLQDLCSSVRYWIVDFPHNNTNLFRFSFTKKNRASICEVCSQFQNEIPYIRKFRSVLESHKDQMALKAAEHGLLDVLQFLHKELSLRWTASACAAAASNGHVDCLIYLHKQGCPWDASTLQSAGTGGHLACLKYAHSHGCTPNDMIVISGAVEHGHLECVKYMVTHGLYTSDGVYDICAEAAASSSTAILAYLLANNIGSVDEVCNSAATYGSLPCLQFAFSQGCSLDRSAYLAAQAGHVDCLVFALAHQDTLSAYALGQICNIAVHRGFVECLKAAHTAGCPVSKYTMLLAVRHDRLACVEYLHGQGCPWDADVTAMAALHGRLACLQYLHQHGCDWDERTVKGAVTQECLSFALSHGCPGTPRSSTAN